MKVVKPKNKVVVSHAAEAVVELSNSSKKELWRNMLRRDTANTIGIHPSPFVALAVGLLAAFLPARTVAATFQAVAAPGGAKVAWGDYNNDGWVDFQAGGTLWRNNGGFTFIPERSLEASGLWGDYNNDGWLDYYAYNNQQLFRSQSGNSFVLTTLPSLPVQASRGASWGDFNNDGFLDLYTGGYENYPDAYYSDVILQNNQGTSFSQTWMQPNDAIVTSGRPRPGRGVTSADFDRDGDLDVYVSNYRLEPNQLHVNGGNGIFSDQAATRGVQGGRWGGTWGHAIGAAWGDFNNDGEIDLFAGHFAHPGQPESQFLRNRGAAGGYTFEDMGQGGVGWQESYASPVVGDYDNDGYLDLYFTAVYSGDHPRLYRNNGDWSFTDVTSIAGLAGLGVTYQAGFADYDNDGDLDLVTEGKLFQNQGNNNHWLKVKLVGDGQSINRDAVGAQVRIDLGNHTLLRQVEFGTGEGNQNESTLHFGLGGHTAPVDLEIFWPGGASQVLFDLPVDQLSTVEFGLMLGDFDIDNQVDGNDFLVWQSNPGVGSLADWQTNYGMSLPSVVVDAVPEPSGFVLIVGCHLLVFIYRKRLLSPDMSRRDLFYTGVDSGVMSLLPK
ncbi:CRTAC1 family protein [Adhaeretor mobilis]|uniref:FG-GAP repeat protein n=1 Tax=Adhaeretor mobilis TaxID=1930276 RepID=A0A517MZU1_9BACT|nr:CRTAC1 family protein [Adhaeretor mobilis]QDT00399.1 FG-GAP repeat protein [Adhaeretor mobilis]